MPRQVKASTTVGCPLLRYVPPVPRCESKHTENRLTFERDAFVFVISKLMEHPDLKRDCKDFLASAIDEKERLQRASLESGAVVAPTLGKYDGDFMGVYISKKTGISLEALGKAVATEPGIVRSIFRGLLNATDGLVMPVECMNDQVMTRSCDKRLETDGLRKRLDCLMTPAPIINPGGNINLAAGWYATEAKSDGLITKLVHRPTGDSAAVPEAENIRKGTWWIVNNLDDHSAKLWASKTMNKKCMDYFAEGAGPKKVKIMKSECEVWNKLVAAEVTAMQRRSDGETTTASSSKDTAPLHTPTKEKKSEAGKRMREALQKKDGGKRLKAEL